MVVPPPAQTGHKCLKSEEKIEEGGRQISAIKVTVGRSRKMTPPSPVHHPPPARRLNLVVPRPPSY